MTIIRVTGLGKEYLIGARQQARETFREMLASSVTASLRRLRKAGGEVTADERFWALKDVNFEVQPGEVVGIIGANGAGKSTLLKILSRITDPTAGDVAIRGRVASLLEVGTGFHSELTGRENIYLNGAILGMRRREIDRKFDEIVDFSGIEKFIDTPVKRYSSGMYVRLAFAVAAHLEPEILVVDEVLAVGDVAFQSKCLGKMGDVAISGRTILVVSHNMAVISNLCSRGLLLNAGRLVSSGPIAECIATYLAGLYDGEETENKIASPYLLGVGFLNQGQPVGLRHVIEMGGGFRVWMRVRPPPEGKKVKIGLVLYKKVTGESIFDVNSDMTGDVFYGRGSETLDVVIDFPGINVVRGEYSITAILGNEYADYGVFPHLLSLTILAGDVYGTGRTPRGCIFVHPKFQIARCDSES